MTASLVDFLIAVAAQARDVAPADRPQLLEQLVDEGARSHPDRQLRGVLHHGRSMILDMARKAVTYRQLHSRSSPR